MTNEGISTSTYVPAPTGGWNARDPLHAMDPQDAITLENWFPDVSSVTIAPGFTSYNTNSVLSDTAPAYTLAEYVKADGTRYLLSSRGKGWIDVSTESGAGTDLTGAVTVTSGKWQSVNFRTNAVSYFIAVNGVDQSVYWDGSGGFKACNYTNASLSSDATFSHVNVYRNRLYFVEKNSARVWYTSAGQATGALTDAGVDFGPFLKRGGFAVWTAAWSFSTGAGLVDYFLVMSNMGECLVYSGSYPGDAAWLLAGRVFVPPPLGLSVGSTDIDLARRSFFNLDGNLIIITQEGCINFGDVFSKAEDTGSTNRKFTDKIQSAFNFAAKNYSNNYGWEGITNNKNHLCLINIPISGNATSEQYVMNTLSGAWCKLTGRNAVSWSNFKGDLYFGGVDGKIYKTGIGYSTNGTIVAKLQTAYVAADDIEHVKRLTQVKPLLNVSSTITQYMGVEVDFKPKPAPQNTFSVSNPSGTAWDTDYWDSFYWGDDDYVADFWVGVDGVGAAFSIRMEGNITDAATINGFHARFESGGQG